MSEPIHVFINEQMVAVQPGATVREAVAMLEPALAHALLEGTAYVTDGVGRALEPSHSVEPGSILRVVHGARVAPPRERA